MAKINVLQLIHALEFGGSERLAVSISAILPRDRFNASVCGLFGAEGSLVPELRRQGISHYYLRAENKSKMVFFYDLYRLFCRLKIDIVQVHGAYGLMHCILPAKLAGVKIIYTEHAKHSILNFRNIGFAARYMPYFVAKTVCVSENLYNFFLNFLGVNKSRLQIIYNGIHFERFKTESTPFPDGCQERIIGCVARLTEAKDHKNLLSAFAIVLNEKKRGVRLMLVGDGELRGAIEERISILGIQKHVDMLGGRDNIPELLGQMDIFVLPSKREGFPVSILEAMAAGRPVVATEVGGVPEVISSGENGIIVQPENTEMLVNALLSLLDNPVNARLIALNGQKLVSEKFNTENMIASYCKLFEETAGVK